MQQTILNEKFRATSDIHPKQKEIAIVQRKHFKQASLILQLYNLAYLEYSHFVIGRMPLRDHFKSFKFSFFQGLLLPHRSHRGDIIQEEPELHGERSNLPPPEDYFQQDFFFQQEVVRKEATSTLEMEREAAFAGSKAQKQSSLLLLETRHFDKLLLLALCLRCSIPWKE